MAVPQYLSWSSTPITFNREDHPDKVVAPGVYPLVVDPIIINTRLSKVLMDGGSSLNIIYLETLDLLGIDRGRLQPSAGGFHGVVPGKKALPVGRIDLPVCFGTAANFRKETLTIEVVGFRGTYHAIIGRPGYAKFMATQLHLLEAEDARPQRRHHCQFLLRACLRVRCRVRRVRGGSRELHRDHHEARGPGR